MICINSANSYRRNHVNTPDLEWDDGLASSAQAYANILMNNAILNSGIVILLHDPTNRNQSVGENLWYQDHADVGNCTNANEAW